MGKKGNSKGSVRRGSSAPKGNNIGNKSRRPNARSNGASNCNSNNHSKSKALQLGERLEMMVMEIC